MEAIDKPLITQSNNFLLSDYNELILAKETLTQVDKIHLYSDYLKKEINELIIKDKKERISIKDEKLYNAIFSSFKNKKS